MNEGETRQDALKRGERKRDKEDRKARRQEVKKKQTHLKKNSSDPGATMHLQQICLGKEEICHFGPKFVEVCGWQSDNRVRGHFMF